MAIRAARITMALAAIAKRIRIYAAGGVFVISTCVVGMEGIPSISDCSPLGGISMVAEKEA
jgi:hypothetical protein